MKRRVVCRQGIKLRGAWYQHRKLRRYWKDTVQILVPEISTRYIDVYVGSAFLCTAKLARLA